MKNEGEREIRAELPVKAVEGTTTGQQTHLSTKALRPYPLCPRSFSFPPFPPPPALSYHHPNHILLAANYFIAVTHGVDVSAATSAKRRLHGSPAAIPGHAHAWPINNPQALHRHRRAVPLTRSAAFGTGASSAVCRIRIFGVHILTDDPSLAPPSMVTSFYLSHPSPTSQVVSPTSISSGPRYPSTVPLVMFSRE